MDLLLFWECKVGAGSCKLSCPCFTFIFIVFPRFVSYFLSSTTPCAVTFKIVIFIVSLIYFAIWP